MILRDYCVDWIIGWVACWIAFMSVFFSLEKIGFKKWLDTSSIPPWHLSVYRSSQAFSYRNPNTSSTPGGSIEKAPASSIASRHLVDRSSFCSWVWCVIPRYILDTSAVDDHFLNTYLDSFLDTSRHLQLLDSCSTPPICRGLRISEFKSDFLGIREYVFRPSLLLTLDI